MRYLRYLGLIRLYSFADLALLLVALRAPWQAYIGILLVWKGFLLLLEAQHCHNYRPAIPEWLWVPCFAVGALFFPHWELVGFIVLGVLYTYKSLPNWGYFSPLLRGAQGTLLAASLVGYHTYIPWVVGVLILARNLVGDIRDQQKDAKAGMTTLATRFKLTSSTPHVHLAAVLGTSFAWFFIGRLPIWWLLIAWTIELATYHWTER